jgi:hypothetical protein
VGVPGEVPAGGSFTSPPGAVHVIYGSPKGLSSVGNQLWSQDSPGIAGKAGEADSFGSSLAAGHFAGGAYADLAVGVPNEHLLSGLPDCCHGAVNVIYGSASGLTATGNQMWSQDSAGIPGRAEHADSFGTSLAAGDFTGTGYDALAVGVMGESVGEVVRAGAVNVIYGSPSGLAARGSQMWTQESTGIAGTAERDDYFGAALAAANFGRHDCGLTALARETRPSV